MATINLRDNRQVIDYLARDYNSFRQALIDLIPAKLPEWTDRSEADFGIVLIELFAYMADILSYYQDRLANEAFLTTAQERRSVIEHLRLIGYEMAPAAPATARLSLIVGNNVNQSVEVRKGDQFATASTKDRPSVTFEYTEDKPLVIDFSALNLAPDSATNDDGTPLINFKQTEPLIPVREGRTIIGEVVGVSDGSPNQQFKLAQPGVLPDSLQITVATSPPTPPWRLRKTLILSPPAFSPDQLAALEQAGRIGSTLGFSRNADPDYAIRTDENNVTSVIFGDGQYGQIPQPASQILATYRVGGGTIGNVGARQINRIANAAQLQLIPARVVNVDPASGGADIESIDHAVKFAPTVFASMQRAVTADDYVAQARLFPGVSKARAVAGNWNTVTLYIAPAGSGDPPSDILKNGLLAYFEDKRMVTTLIQIESPTYVRVVIEAEVGVLPYFDKEKVKGDVQAAIQNLLDFQNVDFKQVLYLSKIYEVIEATAGVSDFAFVKTFNRLPGVVTAPIPPDGRIVLGENEIPVLRPGDLTISDPPAGA
jgi:uncharacterized phage protein gp47/JayE